MNVMKYYSSDWLKLVAMKVEGAINFCVDVVLQDVVVGRRASFLMWSQFVRVMIHQFELVREVEEAQKQLRALRQIGWVGSYIQKFEELQHCLPNITNEETFYALLFGWTPNLQEHVGTHVREI